MGLTGEGGEGARLVASAAGPGNELRHAGVWDLGRKEKRAPSFPGMSSREGGFETQFVQPACAGEWP